jgi:hypothetical protein
VRSAPVLLARRATLITRYRNNHGASALRRGGATAVAAWMMTDVHVLEACPKFGL